MFECPWVHGEGKEISILCVLCPTYSRIDNKVDFEVFSNAQNTKKQTQSLLSVNFPKHMFICSQGYYRITTARLADINLKKVLRWSSFTFFSQLCALAQTDRSRRNETAVSIPLRVSLRLIIVLTAVISVDLRIIMIV